MTEHDDGWTWLDKLNDYEYMSIWWPLVLAGIVYFFFLVVFFFV